MSSTAVAARRSLCAVLVVVHLACTSWRAQMAPPAEVLAGKPTSPIRALLADSTTATLRNPRIIGDSLVGDLSGGRRAIPLDSVIRVETRDMTALNTILLTTGALFVLAAVGFGIWYANCVSNDDC